MAKWHNGPIRALDLPIGLRVTSSVQRMANALTLAKFLKRFPGEAGTTIANDTYGNAACVAEFRQPVQYTGGICGTARI